jgi:hypothetical protein
MGVDRYAWLAALPGLAPGVPVEIDEGAELRCPAADDREGQRQTESRRAYDRLWAAADGDPDGERVLYGAWPDAGRFERCPVPAVPGDALALADREQ